MPKLTRLRFIICLLQFILLSEAVNISYPQARINEFTSTGFKVEIIVPQFKHREIQKGNFTVRDYFEFTDEGAAEQIKLPRMSLVFALPPDSKPEILVTNKITRKEKFILLARNPKTHLDEAGSLAYEELDFKNIVSVPSQRILDIKGYFYLRGEYCAAYRLILICMM